MFIHAVAQRPVVDTFSLIAVVRELYAADADVEAISARVEELATK